MLCEILSSVVCKRDNKSNQPESNYQVTQKDSTQVDTNPGLKFQDIKKDSAKKADKQSKGGDGEGDEVGSNKVGDVAGGKNNVILMVECNICGKLSNNISENNTHLSNTHSQYAISVAKEFDTKGFQKPQKLHKCLNCDRNFFFYQTWENHVLKCHNDMSIIGGGDEQLINVNSSSDTDEDDIVSIKKKIQIIQ